MPRNGSLNSKENREKEVMEYQVGMFEGPFRVSNSIQSVCESFSYEAKFNKGG